MVADYGSIAETVKDFLITQITGLENETASVGDIDYVMDGLLENSDTTVGCIVDFLYSVPHAGDSGRRTTADLWDTFIGGLLIVQFTGRGDTETAKNDALNLLWRAFDGGSSKILTGTDRVSITRIERPEKSAIAEHPYYFMPFTIKVNHGGK